MLTLLNAPDLAAVLVDKPACEVPGFVLVKSGGGQAALDGSWLWQKLTAPAESDGALIAQAAWGTASLTCGQAEPANAPFGTRMPQLIGGETVSDERLAAVRNWICGGATGL
jgi:hypothetical protein